MVPQSDIKDENGYTLVLGGVGIHSFATIGIFKAFQKARIPVKRVITTGWPTLFVLAASYLKSNHDWEWFATRLKEEDLSQLASFRGGANADSLIPEVVNKSGFGDSLKSTRVRFQVGVSVCNLENQDAAVFYDGSWKMPLVQTFSFGGLYRPYQKTLGYKVKGLDVEEAVRQGDKAIIAVDMYGPMGKFERDAYWELLRKETQADYDRANYKVKVHVPLGLLDFSARAKRQAIQAGYAAAKQLIKDLK